MLSLASFFICSAQSDSSRNIRFSGIQLSGGFILSTPYHSLTLQEYRSFIKNDPLLNLDLSGYQSNSYSGSQFMPAFSLKVYGSLKPKKKLEREVFVGVRTCSDFNSSLAYSRTEMRVIDTYPGQNGNPPIYRVKEERQYYNFDLTSTHTYLQLGYSLCTPKEHWIWFTAGFELAPGITTNFRYTSSESFNTVEAMLIPNSNTGKNEMLYDYSTQQSGGNYSTTKLEGLGFAMYSSLPLSFNLRFGKRIAVLKNLQMSATINPLASLSQDRYMGSSIKYGVSAELGLRVNW